MPNYFYVKSGGTRGTADTPYTSLQTGAFPASTNCYADIITAFSVTTTPPASGDFILVSDLHTRTTQAATEVWAGGATNNDPVWIISVDDTACNTYKKGASELSSVSGPDDITFQNSLALYGLNLKPEDNFNSSIEAQILFYDCDLAVYASNRFSMSSDNFYACFTDCTFDVTNAADGFIAAANNPRVEFYNCSFSGNASGDGLVDTLITSNSAVNAGLNISFVGCDLSACDGYLLKGVGGSAANDDAILVNMDRCKLHASAGVVNETLQHYFHRITLSNCAATADAAEYAYQHLTYGLSCEDEINVYRDASTAFPSGQKISLKCVSSTEPTFSRPAKFDLYSRYAGLSSADSDVITLHFTTDTLLDDGDVWAEVMYPDRTNKHVGNRLTSVTDPHSPFRTPGSLDTTTESWTGAKTYKYKIDLDTSTDAGADCVPIIRVYVAKASATIYFCPTVEAS